MRATKRNGCLIRIKAAKSGNKEYMYSVNNNYMHVIFNLYEYIMGVYTLLCNTGYFQKKCKNENFPLGLRT